MQSSKGLVITVNAEGGDAIRITFKGRGIDTFYTLIPTKTYENIFTVKGNKVRSSGRKVPLAVPEGVCTGCGAKIVEND